MTDHNKDKSLQDKEIPLVDLLDDIGYNEEEMKRPIKIGYISDTHIDFYSMNNERKIRSFAYTLLPKEYKHKTFKQSQEHGALHQLDIIIVAGDIGHYNSDNMWFLDELSKYVKEKVIVVTGNHDYYLIGSNVSKYNRVSNLRVKEFEYFCDSHDKIELLQGRTIEVSGIRILGFNGWYDGEYGKVNLKRSDAEIEAIWRTYLNDSRRIMPSPLNHRCLHNAEMLKLSSLKEEVDIVVSHVNPSILPEHQTEKYRNDPVTSFFCFNGTELLKKFNPKLWFFGHSHGAKGYNIGATEFKVNTLGYPGEITNDSAIKVIEYEIQSK